jgi:serine/threonine protein kinase
MENLDGKQFGAYRIISPFGEGGMATVYKAYQPSMDRFVALKVLPRFHSTDPEFIGRFEQEAKALAQLQHPHILPVYDFGESDGYTYFVMPLMQSGNLAELLAVEKLSLERINQVISQVGTALEFAHSRGFIHRDVKPSNILRDESGNCMLMDFGIAKIIEGSKEFTRTGGILGTPAYMSPEQGSGKKINYKSDIYSLGIILYEMVTGRPPFDAETPVAIIFKHVHAPLPPPSTFNPALSEEVERVILKSLAKEPADRYESVRAMVDALSRAVTASQRSALKEVDLPPTIQDKKPEAISIAADFPVKDLKREQAPGLQPTKEEVDPSLDAPQILDEFPHQPSEVPDPSPSKKFVLPKLQFSRRTTVIGIAGVLIAIIAIFFIAGAINQPSAVAPTLAPPLVPNVQIEDIHCLEFIQNDIDVRSAWLDFAVDLDGRITSDQEWSDTACLNVTLGEPNYVGDEKLWEGRVTSKWWIKNDDQWVYFLVGVHVKEASEPGAAVNYFWPLPYNEVTGWEHSDGAWVDRDGETWDSHGWDEETWYADTQEPGGENNVEGMSAREPNYYWFEFRKPLDSGDRYDWSWTPGESIGEVGDLLLIVVDSGLQTHYELDIKLQLADG